MPVSRIDRIAGTALPLPGNNIDTDRIIPARFLRSVTFDGLETHLFEDDRAQAKAAGVVHPVDDPRYTGARILLVTVNFGCGSSREHAPQALQRAGIGAVVGESFSEIFFGNSVALGMPCVSASPDVLATLLRIVAADPTTVMTVDLESMSVSAGAETRVLSMPRAARDGFLDGSWDATGLLLDRYDEVEATAARLPYITGAWL